MDVASVACICYPIGVSAVSFDTLKLADRLAAGGFTSEQARAAASALADAAVGADVATKQDLLLTRQLLTRALVELEQRVTIRLGGLIVVAVGVLLAGIRYLPASGHG
jgi:hypothetical protein